MTDQLTPEELAVLRKYAADKGRTWKDQLRLAWMNGTDVSSPDGGILRRLRNQRGPGWLQSFRFPEKSSQPADPLPE